MGVLADLLKIIVGPKLKIFRTYLEFDVEKLVSVLVRLELCIITMTLDFMWVRNVIIYLMIQNGICQKKHALSCELTSTTSLLQ